MQTIRLLSINPLTNRWVRRPREDWHLVMSQVFAPEGQL